MYGFIYMTTNQINGKKYIGQKEFDSKGRWKKYLGSGIAITRAIKKYGKNNFKREIIENCDSKEMLDEREKYWIKFYDAVKNDAFYNIASGGDGGNTISGFSEERLHQLKKLHSKRSIEYHKNRDSGFNTKLTKDIVVNTIIPRLKNNEFNSDIAKELNVSTETINDIRHHKTWKKYTNGIIFDDISERKRGRTPKRVSQYSLDGIKIKCFNSAEDAGKQFNINPTTIMDVCSGNKKKYHGYIWRYEDDSFDKYDTTNHNCVKVDKYSNSGEYICTYNSIKEANDSISSGDVRSVLYGQAKSAGGYYWCRNNENFLIPTYKNGGIFKSR